MQERGVNILTTFQMICYVNTLIKVAGNDRLPRYPVISDLQNRVKNKNQQGK
jgi:hypothetical protein